MVLVEAAADTPLMGIPFERFLEDRLSCLKLKDTATTGLELNFQSFFLLQKTDENEGVWYDFTGTAAAVRTVHVICIK